MKKIFKGLLLMLVFLLPMVVNADMGAPMTIKYNAVVIKEGGIDYYDLGKEKNGHLNKDTEIVVHGETKFDKEIELYFCFANDDTKCFYTVDVDGIAPKDKGVVDPTKVNVRRLNTPKEFMINADNLELKEGPSAVYKTVTTLKKGQKGKYRYFYDNHFYIEVDGYKGWVNIMGKTVLTKSLGAITVNEVKTNKCGVIPKNTELTEVWEASMWDGESLVIYNGCEEFISTFKSSEIFIYSIPAEIVTSGTTTFTDVAEGKTTELPSGTKATLIAHYGGTISGGETLYVNYNNVKGWLKTTEESSYEYVNGYPSEDEWVNDTDPVSDDNPDEAPVSSSDDNSDTTGDVAPLDPKPDQDQKEEAKDNKSKGFNKLAIIIMCCIGAFAVAIAAVVTIILVNVGKKNKTAPAPTPAVVPEPEKTEPVKEEVEEESALEEKPEPAPFPVKPVEDPEEKQKNEEKDNQ